MGYLTTHILDTTNGLPANNVTIKLYRLTETKTLLKETCTNDDGRCDSPILAEDDFASGKYEIEFAIGDYFRRLDSLPEKQIANITQKEPLFLDDIVIRFGINNEDSHYHVPLLVSPYGYSTYRGS